MPPGIETRLPDRIGSYPIERELGRGSMGVVYLASDPRLDRPLALKVLSERVATDADVVRRFEQEARILAAVAHPNIATVYSLEESDEHRFLTMEFVPGETLADTIARGPMSLDGALCIAHQVACALETAHRQGVVHRDLKPANVMVSSGPWAKVLDFGLAKARPGSISADTTTSGSLGPIVGTPGYASPEQLRGEDVDQRSDVWAFGCLLYECLTGSASFPGETRADRIASTLRSAPDWSAIPASTPEPLLRLLRRCLEVSPRRRVSSIGRVRSRIDDIRSGRPSSDSTPPDLEELDAPHNLPLPLASLIGRRQEMLEVPRALREHRLVTLTGTGGSGKTRLAIEVGHQLLSDYPDGVWLAPIATLTDGGQVAVRFATVLGLQEERDLDVLEVLVRHLDGRRVVLVLDSCDHLLADCAQFADTLLSRIESVRILTTSREPLGLPGEVVYRVPPLSVPDGTGKMALADLERIESVQLFVTRATAAAAGFALTEDNADHVARICRRLDGIPLALELAAARVSALPPEEIARRLHDRFHLLSGGSLGREPRHQTLRALIDWSHELLPDEERALFRRLSVFSGGWNLDDAERVCAGGDIELRNVLALLSHLVERSLVEVGGTSSRGSGPRYRMLKTIRAYAREQLGSAPDRADVTRRHREHFADLSAQAFCGLTGPDQAAWVARLEDDHDNLRAALNAFMGAEDPLALEMAGTLGRFWYVRGRWSEGRELLTRALERPEAAARNAPRARALSWCGWLAYWLGDFEDADTVLAEALSISRELGDAPGVAEALNNLGAVAKTLGELDRARQCHAEALEIRRRAGDRRSIAVSVHNLGEVYLSQGDHEKARVSYEESERLFRDAGHIMGVADSLSCLGQIAEHFGDIEKAKEYHRESLENRREREDPMGTAESLRHLGQLAAKEGHRGQAHALLAESLSIRQKLGDRMDIADGLEALGELIAEEGPARHAARVLGASQALRERIGAAASADDRERFEQAAARVRRALGREEFEVAWRAGREMSLSDSIELALGRHS